MLSTTAEQVYMRSTLKQQHQHIHAGRTRVELGWALAHTHTPHTVPLAAGVRHWEVWPDRHKAVAEVLHEGTKGRMREKCVQWYVPGTHPYSHSQRQQPLSTEMEKRRCWTLLALRKVRRKRQQNPYLCEMLRAIDGVCVRPLHERLLAVKEDELQRDVGQHRPTGQHRSRWR